MREIFIAVILVFVLVIILTISFYFVVQAVKPNSQSIEKQLEKNPNCRDLVDTYCENWEITSKRNTKLFARFYPNQDCKKIILLIHGYNAPFVSMLKYLPLLQKLGYSVLMPDNQAQGKSEGKFITYGIFESEDAFLWLEKLKKEFPNAKFAVMGESLGAATTILLAEKHSESLEFCVADCPYNDMANELSFIGTKRYKLPMNLFMPFCKLWFKILTERSMSEASPISQIHNLKIPMLLVHGDADKTVPVEMSRILSAKNKNITYFEAENAGHAAVISLYPDLYEEKFLEFINSTVCARESVLR